MSDPVQCVVSYPSPAFSVIVQTAAGFPVTMPPPSGGTFETNTTGSVSVEFPNSAPPQVVVLPATGPAGRAGVDGPPGADGPPGPAGADGVAGPAGTNAPIVVLTLAAYLALSTTTQMNGTWYVIPK